MMTALKTMPDRTRRSQNLGLNPAVPATPAQQSRKAILATKLFPWMTAVALVSLVGNALMYARFTTLRPLVTIGNKTITKREYLAVLDDTAGKQVLNKIVFAELIRQAAAKSGVTPTAKETDARLSVMRAANPQFAAAVPLWKLRDAVTSDLALENLRTKDVKVSDAEALRYYAAHPNGFRQQGQLQAALIVTSSSTDTHTAAHLFQQNIDPSIIAKQPSFHLVGANGFTIDLQRPSHRDIVKAIFAMKTGSVQTFPLDGQFLTVRVYSSQGTHVVPFTQTKNQAIRLTKLEKAPSAKAIVAELYKSNPPMFDIGKYSEFFDDITQPNATQARSVR